jgi:hypothetical protein
VVERRRVVLKLLKHHGGAYDGVLWELVRTAKADHAKETSAAGTARFVVAIVQFGI